MSWHSVYVQPGIQDTKAASDVSKAQSDKVCSWFHQIA